MQVYSFVCGSEVGNPLVIQSNPTRNQVRHYHEFSPSSIKTNRNKRQDSSIHHIQSEYDKSNRKNHKFQVIEMPKQDKEQIIKSIDDNLLQNQSET